MKILHIINNLGIGGAEKLIVDTLPALKSRGSDVELLVLNKLHNTLELILESENILIHSVNTRNIYNPFIILKLRRYLRNYDIVHVHLFPSQYWSALASVLIPKRCRPVLITTEHSTSNRRRNLPLFKCLDRYIYSKYKSIVCITESTYLSLKSYLGITFNAEVIENGVNLEKFVQAKPTNLNDFDFKENDIIITMVAGFRHQKDQDTLIRSMQYLPSNYKLLLVGVGERMEICQKLCGELNLNKRIVFTGLRNDIENVFAMSKVGVVSSHWEGFGLVAVECMATGRPVIASDVEGLRDVVGDPCLLFPQGDEKALASRIIEVVSSDSYYNKLSQKCLAQSKAFSINTMVGKTRTLYKKLFNEKNN